MTKKLLVKYRDEREHEYDLSEAPTGWEITKTGCLWIAPSVEQGKVRQIFIPLDMIEKITMTEEA